MTKPIEHAHEIYLKTIRFSSPTKDHCLLRACMYRNCAENVENYVKKIIEESTSALDLPQTHRRMLVVFKEKTRGSNYREKASYCPTIIFFFWQTNERGFGNSVPNHVDPIYSPPPPIRETRRHKPNTDVNFNPTHGLTFISCGFPRCRRLQG